MDNKIFPILLTKFLFIRIYEWVKVCLNVLYCCFMPKIWEWRWHFQPQGYKIIFMLISDNVLCPGYEFKMPTIVGILKF